MLGSVARSGSESGSRSTQSVFEPGTGRSVLLAEVQDSAQIVVSDTEALYPNGLDSVAASWRLRIGIDRFEQDLVLHEAPPAPESFNLDPERTRLVVITEFFDTAPPVRQRLDPGTSADTVDQSLIWGEMRTAPGRAFVADKETEGVPVFTTWETI